ncbi:DUF4062 domain-containing protein [Pseudonocardia alni]|uniref:DUF4062 domain-containing protein n=1 Tax=Pseudonocardia alni TaxID=33907 RepID=UPI00332F9257
MAMRIFVSSVSEGLVEERQACKAIIRALGHNPVLFEDFTPQSEPSREACLRELADSDIYVLLLGPHYGHRFPDTGTSPTHEEWVSATASGMPRIVFRKTGATFEEEQQAFARTVSDYTSGVFRGSFEKTHELTELLARKVRELETTPSQLSYTPLAGPPAIDWLADFSERGSSSLANCSLEVHVSPIDATNYPSRVMSQIGSSLDHRLRSSGFVPGSVGFDVSADSESARVQLPQAPRASWDEPQAGQVLGIRLSKAKQLSAWASLPRDSMGSILDRSALPDQIANLLRLLGALNILEAGQYAIHAGINRNSSLTVGVFDPQRSRNTASLLSISDKPLRYVPDESASEAALTTGASEVADHLARMLLEQFQRAR